MPNPNNCATCDHRANPDGGWCYMFRDEPQEVCKRHTAHNNVPVPYSVWRLGFAAVHEWKKASRPMPAPTQPKE